MNIPNGLTAFRIGCAPVLVILFYLPFSGARITCALLLVLVALTDWLDGYLARRWQQTSRIGAILDPMADKLMVCVGLVLLVGAHGSPWIALPTAVIILREILISALRELMAELGQRTRVTVVKAAKWKLTVQMIAIIAMMYQESIANISMYTVGLGLLYLAMLLTLWTMITYLRAAWPALVPMESPTPKGARSHPINLTVKGRQVE